MVKASSPLGALCVSLSLVCCRLRAFYIGSGPLYFVFFKLLLPRSGVEVSIQYYHVRRPGNLDDIYKACTRAMQEQAGTPEEC